ncbi:D-hexose-6-phosphate mutarotase [Psychrobium sp. MM17-31]|uniref:D-hexose-6-phosphate mutarotase n=1 Tax=Psychrobium sp. MM17-31 TaxID=2917758 RepID=UPI001EF4F1D4|nr:D-hexose-6-phosphate mutarotase [Psychrobium sp. MM17-31]MCG7533242.1 D-hexose-6-phosphate mutarotase [Psychrobium sp. MM17-31]
MNSPYISYSDTRSLYQGEESLPLIIVDSPLCRAVISRYGGQILEFQAKDKQPLLWLSKKAIFKSGKAIRGGIPVCAPWFGNHPDHQLSHGFARTSMWHEESITTTEDNKVTITLALMENELSQQYNYHDFAIKVIIELSDELNLNFVFENRSRKSLECEWAFHSYFAVNNVEDISVDGLDAQHYLDKTKENALAVLDGQQRFTEEVDRAFVTATQTQQINTTTPVIIDGDNCPSAIVWNPGKELASQMADVCDYRNFVCVERGAISDNKWQIAPNESISASMRISY